MPRKGVIVAAGLGTRLHPMTLAVNKQLIPIYDKPMIYYAVWVMLKAGVRDIMLITSPGDKHAFDPLFGDGSRLGIHMHYAVQEVPNGVVDAFINAEEFVGSDPCVLLLGDNIFYGPEFPSMLAKAAAMTDGATVFGCVVPDPERFGVASVDENGKVLTLEEKPAHPKSNTAVVGLYFYDGNVMKYSRQLLDAAEPGVEVSITDVNRIYMEQGKLSLQVFPQGFAWLDSGTYESLLEASNFVARVEKESGRTICCPEEAAALNGFLDIEKLREYGEADKKTAYGKYLLKLYEELKK